MVAALNVIVIEDHDLLREATVSALQSAGHKAKGLVAAEDLVEQTTTDLPDIYLIDLNLPGEDGISLSQRLRAAHPQVGIIMVTARSGSGQSVTGYASGADLYLTKPVALEELLAAVEALGRRVRSVQTSSILLKLNTHSMQLQTTQRHVALTQSEAMLLVAFVHAANQTLERYQVAEQLKISLDNSAASDTMQVRISYLRKKFAELGYADAIRSMRVVGYKLLLPIEIY